jgi:L-2-hydroxyglutarate oxidase LhgO
MAHPGRDWKRLDIVVVGAGVVGLAIARVLALGGRQVLIVDAEPGIGAHTSSRSSEVIHAGIYYPTGSLKARYCVRGKQLLYDYCKKNGVGHARLGKLIVALRDEEVTALERIETQAEANGVTDLRRVSRREIRALEPEVTAVGGLLSPSTGILDSHGFMGALRRDAEHAGADVVPNTPVLSGRVLDDGLLVEVGGSEPISVSCRTLINAAGLGAQAVARSIAGVPPDSIPGSFLAKGHYFVLRGRSPFSRLVYPVPVAGGLGVHVTLDLGGQARFGPDISWLDSIDYSFDEARAASFYAAIRRYYPALAEGSLEPGYTGIRPKLGPAGAPAQDFVIQGPQSHGVPGLVNLYGIESPGLTAALAIAEDVGELVAR